jgi:lipopolysaccharide biosynthesis glycosyltransferase
MIIVLASDNNFVQHCAVAMISILKNNDNVVFYLITNDFSDSNKKLITNLVNENNGKLNIVIVNENDYKSFPMPKMQNLKHISLATYFRLFISELLPETIKKVIYLDCDVVVRNKLNKLWEEDISNYALGAVYQNNEWALQNKSFERLDIPEEKGYFNAGILLINLSFWREKNAFSLFNKYIETHQNDIIFHDQDVLNGVFYKNTKPISITWNYIPLFFNKKMQTLNFPSGLNYTQEILQINNSPTIIHYVYRPKPWEYGCKHPYKDDYFKYISYTPWKNKKSTFKLNQFYKFKVAPTIHPILKKIFKMIGIYVTIQSNLFSIL